MATAINYHPNELDQADAAEPLPLTVEDLRMLAEFQTRTVTIPIVLLDSILPGQEVSIARYVTKKTVGAFDEFQLTSNADVPISSLTRSSEPNFAEMIRYALGSDSSEIGIIGKFLLTEIFCFCFCRKMSNIYLLRQVLIRLMEHR